MESFYRSLKVLQNLESNPQVRIFQEIKVGKHNALNKGLENTQTEFVGCLDADSTVHPESLKRIMSYFVNADTMAVAPSIVVRNPKNILQFAQRAEYDMAHYNKKMLAFLGGIHVTPGPFSIFRKTVFDKIGIYRKAHQTSARYPREISEFEATGLTPDFKNEFYAPFVKESNIQLGVKFKERIDIRSNNTILVIGEIIQLYFPENCLCEDGFIDIQKAQTITGTGLDSYHKTIQLDRLSYAKPDRELTSLL